jgi:flagellar hook protein FlgE
MSLFASLTTAITGLNAQQEAIGNISDNIANSSTVGFKDIGTTFQSLVSESTPQLNQPGGVVATPLYQNNVPGPTTPTGVNTNLAIVGNGFFQVKAPPPATAQGVAPTFSQQDLYTQAGDFTLNNNGFLVNSAGDYLTGYNVNPQSNVVDTSTTAPIQISALVDSPQATANLNLAANLPSNYAIQGTPGYVAPSPITEQIFDASGNAQTISIQLQHTATNTWTATISAPGTIPPSPSQVTLNFGDGTTPYPGSPNPAPAADIPAPGDLLSITDSTTVVAGPPPTPVTTPSTTTPGTGAAAGFTLPLDFGSGVQPISFNLGNFGQATGVTGFSDPTGAVTVQTKTQDGVARGEFQSVSIDSSGFVDINYTNGQTKSFYQIPVVQFNAPDQLQRLAGSAFGATIDSGAPQVNPPGEDGGGTISPSEVTGSNVDIATEFTKLITAQQVYSANSKVITTANQLLTTVLQLIQ